MLRWPDGPEVDPKRSLAAEAAGCREDGDRQRFAGLSSSDRFLPAFRHICDASSPQTSYQRMETTAMKLSLLLRCGIAEVLHDSVLAGDEADARAVRGIPSVNGSQVS